MKIPVSYSFRSLWTRRLTSALTMGGVGLVVFVFAAVLMLSNGIRQTLVSTGRDDNVLLVRRSSTTEMISAVGRESAAIVTGFPEIMTLDDGRPFASKELSVVINLRKTGSNDMGNVIVRGVAPEGLGLRPQVRIVEGRVFTPGTSEIIVGSAIHAQFQGADIGQSIRFGGRDWNIVGLFDGQKTGFDSEVWGDVDQLMPAFGRPVYSAVTMRLSAVTEFDAFKARMEKDRRLQQLEVRRERQFYSDQSKMMSTFINVLGLVITIIFSFGAVIGAMITMYAAVANRTREIGTLRALGFPRRSILTAFLIESILISLIGGALGVVIASGLQFMTVSTVNWGSFSELAFGFHLSPGIVVGSMVFSLVMGLVGGFLPAVRASRMNILAALRSA